MWCQGDEKEGIGLDLVTRQRHRGKLVKDEARHLGAVGTSTYLTYFGAFNCPPYVFIMISFFFVSGSARS